MILVGIGYYIFQVFIKPYPKSQIGTCYTSLDCLIGGKDSPIEFQCGKRIYGKKGGPAGNITSIERGVCDCRHFQGGGQASENARYWGPAPAPPGGPWSYTCPCQYRSMKDDDGYPTSISNCQLCKCFARHGSTNLISVKINGGKDSNSS